MVWVFFSRTHSIKITAHGEIQSIAHALGFSEAVLLLWKPENAPYFREKTD
jgi:hypothetical protein